MSNNNFENLLGPVPAVPTGIRYDQGEVLRVISRIHALVWEKDRCEILILNEDDKVIVRYHHNNGSMIALTMQGERAFILGDYVVENLLKEEPHEGE